MSVTMYSSSGDFPVDQCLPQLLDVLSRQNIAILQAPPGAGKTTRIPPALLKLSNLEGKSMLLLEPRRLAAVSAASFMARQMGEEVGATVGYTIRYERRVSVATRIEVVTEGVLTRRLINDPELKNIGLVIFDEFHERNLHSDLALALCRDVQMGLRPDLKIVIMSATLETGNLSSLLDDAPVVSSAGKMYPVVTTHVKDDPTLRSIVSVVCQTVGRAILETKGDLLVFLPGAYEIRRTVERLQNEHTTIEICPLYGGLPLADQRHAIEPGQKRKVVVATNVAETSLTIEGVRSVIDSGLEKRPKFDAARGLTTLETTRISAASAKQREGRAGRLGAGRCYRLWSEGVDGSLLSQSPPEITQADLAPLALDLASWGVTEANSLVWVDPPPPGHLAAARRLLRQLGALDDHNRLTRVGEQMSMFPAHPRLSRLLLQAQKDGCPELGADLAALLGEGLSAGKVVDLFDALSQIQKMATARNVDRASKFWRKVLKCGDKISKAEEYQVTCLLAAAYPDRIAMVREGDESQYLLANGMAAHLDRHSPLRGAEFLIVVDLHGRSRSAVRISLGMPFSRDDFEKILGHQAEWRRKVEWDSSRKSLSAQEVRFYGALPLQSRLVNPAPDDIRTALLGWVTKKGLNELGWRKEEQQLRNRLNFVSELKGDKDWDGFSSEGLALRLNEWLGPFIDGVKSVEQLHQIDLKQALLSQLDWSKKKELDRLAPERIKVPGGSNVRIDYSGDQPVLAVKLQELFGLAESPRVAAGKVPVLIHLLSPAGRPLQVTADLKSFWENGYPEVKKEMKGRYPKHPWPDDPWKAEPTKRTKKR